MFFRNEAWQRGVLKPAERSREEVATDITKSRAGALPIPHLPDVQNFCQGALVQQGAPSLAPT